MSQHEDSIPEKHHTSEIPTPSPSPSPVTESTNKPFDHEDFEHERNLRSEIIANDPSLDDPAKIDALTKSREWIGGKLKLLDAYLSHQLTLSDLIEKIAPPIEEDYATCNYGVALWHAEETARKMRPLCATAEEALEEWGAEEEFPEPTLKNPHDEANQDETMMGLQADDMWYSALHASRRLPWDDDTEQDRLVNVLRTLKARPDPVQPRRTVALSRDWFWSRGTLWSNLNMFGIAARDVWNEGCGCASGFTPVEQRAWMNINAFVARLTITETFDFQNYGGWALRDALERSDPPSWYDDTRATPKAERTSCHVKVAAVWILVAGRSLYQRRVAEEGGGKGEEIELDSEDDERFPWFTNKEWTDSRWTYWRRMFEKFSREDVYTDESRDLATKAATEIAIWQGASSD